MGLPWVSHVALMGPLGDSQSMLAYGSPVWVSFQWVSDGSPWDSHAIPMGLPCAVYSTGPWVSYGTAGPMGLLYWPMEPSRVSHGTSMRVPGVYSVRTGLPYNFEGFALLAHGIPVALPWVCSGSMGLQ